MEETYEETLKIIGTTPRPNQEYTGNDSRIWLGQGGALNLNQALAGIEADQLE